jgi:hypothetical protein
MDDAAFSVEVIQPEEDLLCDLLDERHGNAAMVPSFDQTKQILPQHFKHHADMSAIGPFVFEGVQQAHNVFPSWVVRLSAHDLIEEFDFVYGGLGIMGSGADDLQGDVFLGNIVPREPHGREVSPT